MHFALAIDQPDPDQPSGVCLDGDNEFDVLAPPVIHGFVLPEVPDEYLDWLPEDLDSIETHTEL